MLFRSHGKGGNGGFSLRNVSKFCSITPRHSVDGLPNEDLYFSKQSSLKHINNYELHKQFAVEMIYDDNPCGYHAVYKNPNFTRETWEKITTNISNKFGIDSI